MTIDYQESLGMQREKILIAEGLRQIHIMKAGFYNYPLGTVDEKLTEAEGALQLRLHEINNDLQVWYASKDKRKE